MDIWVTDGLESNFLLADLKKEPGRKTAGWLEKAERGMDSKDSELTELKSDELDFFKDINEDWGIDLLYLIGKQMLREVAFQPVGRFFEQQML